MKQPKIPSFFLIIWENAHLWLRVLKGSQKRIHQAFAKYLVRGTELTNWHGDVQSRFPAPIYTMEASVYPLNGLKPF